MEIWILTKKEELNGYENKRFRERAEQDDLELKFVAPEEFEIIVTNTGKRSILHKGKTVELPDCLIPRMGAETTYFALAVIRQLEKLGLYVLNSSNGIECSKDKLSSMQILAANNMPIPKTMLAKFPLNKKVIKKEFNYPIIVKSISGSEGRGVFLCENEAQFDDLLGLLEQSKDKRANIILQEFVTTSKGRDIRSVIIGGRPIGAALRTSRSGGFKANFAAGGNMTELKSNKSLEWLSVESSALLGLEMAGVDLLFDGDNYKICEVNSAPGFKGFESATGIDVPKLTYDYLKVRLRTK